MNLPESLQNKITELEQIVTEYPESIPLTVVARFLGKSPTVVRRKIESGAYQFGSVDRGTKKLQRNSRVTIEEENVRADVDIQAMRFWVWYTGGNEWNT